MKEKKHFTGVSMYLEVESTNWEHYFYVSYWRRNLHFTWSSQPRRGPAACSAKGLPSFLSYSLKTVSRVRSRELNPRPPALQSNALPTELILSGLIIPESRSLPCYSFNATGSPFQDFILLFEVKLERLPFFSTKLTRIYRYIEKKILRKV